MSKLLEYKGYHTKPEYDENTKSLWGKIIGIQDYIDFRTDNTKDFETEFHNAVDDYLEFCEEVGKKPEREYNGTFNIRIKPDCHKQLDIIAKEENVSLNSVIERACMSFLRSYQKSDSTDIYVTVISSESHKDVNSLLKYDNAYEKIGGYSNAKN